MATVAGHHAIACAGLTPEDIDVVILATCTPDSIVPSAAAHVQKKLGAVNAAVYDVNADRYHVFYDLSSGLLSVDKRKWLPNTVIHKVSHAFKKCDDGIYLINHDHSIKWHKYYKSKMIVYSKKTSPIYVRVLNPVSNSAGESNNYDNYLTFFGNWKYKAPESFMLYSKLLLNIQKEKNLYSVANRNSLFRNFMNKFYKFIFK